MADSSAYKKGLKGILVFGGLQIYKMMIGVVSTKISAIFLGPAGVAIYGLFTSTLNTFEAFTSCGLGISAVKDIAQSKGDPPKLATTYKVLKRLTSIVGIVGLSIIFIFATQLSKLTFGNAEYAWGFRVLSVTMIFNQILSSQGALLTGLTEYGLITRMRLWTGVLTVVAVGVLYILWGVKAIVPAIFMSSAISALITIITVWKIKLPKVKISWRETFQLGGPMFKAGIYLSMSWLLNSLGAYIIRVFIGRVGDDVSLGLFISSFALVNTYLGLIFSSIESDFYPHLSIVNGDKKEFKIVASSELELVLLLVVPLVSLLMVFVLPVLQLFYTSKFFGANQIIIWSAVSMVVNIPQWVCSVGLMSLGKTKIYMYNKLVHMLYQLVLNLLGFYFWGLLGIGLTYTIGNAIFSIQSLLILRKFGYSVFDKSSFNMMMALLACTIALAIWCTLTHGWLMYLVGSIAAALICTYGFIQINHRIPVVQMIRSRINKK